MKNKKETKKIIDWASRELDENQLHIVLRNGNINDLRTIKKICDSYDLTSINEAHDELATRDYYAFRTELVSQLGYDIFDIDDDDDEFWYDDDDENDDDEEEDEYSDEDDEEDY